MSDRNAAQRTKIHLNANTLRQLDKLQLSASRYLRGQRIGLRPSLRRVPKAAFREHRKYVAGDDVRFIDWKASARHDQVFIKQGEQPKASSVHILLDCSASMAWGDVPKSKAQLDLAAALGYLTLAHGDRLYARQLGGSNVRLGPMQGKGQMTTYLQFLASLKYHGAVDLSEELASFAKTAPQPGLTFILSDLLGERDMQTGLDWFPVPSWEVVVMHLLHPQELQPVVHGNIRLVDAESGESANYDINADALDQYHVRLDAWRKSLDLACVESNAFYTLLPTDWSLESGMLPHLRSVQIVMPQ